MRFVPWIALWLAGCGGTDCIIGDVVTCACEGGREGVRECNVHGEFGACDCSGPTTTDAASDATSDASDAD